MHELPPPAEQTSHSCANGAPPVAPNDTRRRLDRLKVKREERVAKSVGLAHRFEKLNGYLANADKVTDALKSLSERLFQQLLSVVEEKLSIALQEILEQPIRLRTEAEFKNYTATVDFWIDRGGNREHVLKGQGGSVANVLSVGLRMFALTTLDSKVHRRFLVLDEQDCWLRPDLVPRLVKIVHEASQALGFQVLMISHHDVALFERYADRIYQFGLNAEGEVQLRQLRVAAQEPDSVE
jgi:ABC-type glutathione transport system ATPase component